MVLWRELSRNVHAWHVVGVRRWIIRPTAAWVCVEIHISSVFFFSFFFFKKLEESEHCLAERWTLTVLKSQLLKTSPFKYRKTHFIIDALDCIKSCSLSLLKSQKLQ